MQKMFRWLLVIGGLLAVVVIAVVVIAVMALDVDQLKPKIESQVSQTTGRTFTVGEDLDLSFFPWVGVALSDIKLGNPEGFSEAEFISIEGFEARLKLLPLLRKEIQVKRFVVQNPRIILEKRADGQVSWAFGSPAEEKAPSEGEKAPAEEGLPLAALEVEEFSVTGGSAVWIDQKSKQRTEVSDLNLQLTDLSLDRPVGIDFSAKVDAYPVALQGEVGPVGQQIGKTPLDLDITLKLLEDLVIKLNGRAENLLSAPQADINLEIPTFSPREVAGRVKADLIPQMADPNTLTRLSLKGKIQAASDRFSLSDGVIGLDDTQVKMTLQAKAFSKPDVQVVMMVDAIDVDRYLPTSEASAAEAPPATSSKKEEAAKPMDYGPLRKLVLDATVKAGSLTAKQVHMENVDLKVVAKDGIIRIDPFDMGLYGGGLKMNGTVDVRKAEPRSELKLAVADVAAGPLMRDLSGKDIIEGAMAADINITTRGDAPETIKRFLNGGGSLVFKDGAILGIDLAGMVRNIRSTFTGEARPAEKPKTDFAELAVPFTLTNGTFATTDSRLQSPLLRLDASGAANLLSETLDFRVNPKAVMTLKGQGDTEDRKGITVPVLVGGTFASPTFRPDLESLAREKIEEKILESDKVKEIFEKNEALKPLEETTKGLIKGLFGPKKQ